MTELPIFRLDIVVFPGMTVPLRVTEQRYRRLVRFATEEVGDPARFIIAHGVKAGGLRDGPPTFPEYGTVVNIISIDELSDGGYELVVHGQERCKITLTRKEDIAEPNGRTRQLWFSTEDYAPLARSNPNDERLIAWDTLDTFKDYAGELYRTDHAAEIERFLPADPIYQASFICANIQVPQKFKQPLLEAPTLERRFELARELMLQRWPSRGPKNLA